MSEQISVDLGLDISYVYGTVNGVEASFTLTSPGVWSAVVDKAANCRYEVHILAYNSLGSSTEYNTIVYRLDDMMAPKLDWNREDYYNAEDLNRVEANTQFIAEYLKDMFYTVELEDVKTDRDKTSLDFISSINRVERNIEALRANFITPAGYKDHKSWILGMAFTYLDANRYENNLNLIYLLAQLVKKNFKYCGTYACGEEGVIY